MTTTDTTPRALTYTRAPAILRATVARCIAEGAPVYQERPAILPPAMPAPVMADSPVMAAIEAADWMAPDYDAGDSWGTI